MDDTETEINHESNNKNLSAGKGLKIMKWAAAVVLLVIVLTVSYVGYIYAATPAVIRNPKLEHYHFRMQILVGGKAENLADDKYQSGYSKVICGTALPTFPVHFHDGLEQFTHIHWEGMTGGIVMKYIGWNYIGGPDDSLGYRLDDIKRPKNVTIHGKLLPAVPKDVKFYVYSGDEKSYKERSFNDWKNKDLEEFFGKTSNLPVHNINKGKRDPLSFLFSKASAQEMTMDGDGNKKTEEEKARINNLIGNVVIFAQKNKPTDEQVKDRFNKLTPLSDSACAG